MRAEIIVWLLVIVAIGHIQSGLSPSKSVHLRNDYTSEAKTHDFNHYDADYDEFAPEEAGSWSDQDELLANAMTVLGKSSSVSSAAGLYTKALSLACPSRPAGDEDLPVNKGEGAKLILHRANDDSEPTLLEDRVEMWRKSDVDRLVQNGFNLARPTIIYLMGWKMSRNVTFLELARQNLDRLASKRHGQSPVNMLIFDWFNYSFKSNYGKSVAMVPHLGKVLANFLAQLNERHGYQLDQVHLISYSLSTHIAGYAGRELLMAGCGQLDQITALDPTGVCFHTGSGSIFDREYSLRPTDAKLVVARHYGMDRLGASRLVGGVDVLVNGGRQQPPMAPGAEHWGKSRAKAKSSSFKNLVKQFMTASRNHRRSILHEAVPFEAAGCQDVAYECSSFEKFKQGQCASCGPQNRSCLLISTLGNVELNRKASQVNYKPATQMHISTGWAQFCTFNYQVLVELESEAPAHVVDKFERGQIKFYMADLELRPESRLELDGGQLAFTQLLELDSPIHDFPNRLRVKPDDLFGSIKSISLNYMSNISADVRELNSIQYCRAKDSMLVVCNSNARESQPH